MLKETVARFVDNDVIPWPRSSTRRKGSRRRASEAMADMGLFGISIPEEHGGGEAGLLSCVLVMEGVEFGRCFSTAKTRTVPMRFCARRTSNRNGNEAQRRKYLPDLINGKTIGALCITEPEAGSDPMACTRAVRRGTSTHPQRDQDVHHERTGRRCSGSLRKTTRRPGPRASRPLL